MKNSLIITLTIFLSINSVSNNEDRFKSESKKARTIASVVTSSNSSNKVVIKKIDLTDTEKRIEATRATYLEASKYPATSTPVDFTKTEDHLEMRFTDEPKFLKVGRTIVKLWSQKLYYNRAKDMVKIFYSFKQAKTSNTKLLLKGKNLNKTLISTQVDELTYAATISAKTLDEGDYRVTLEVNNKADVSTSFAVRDHHIDFLKIENDSISSTGNLIFTSKLDVHIKGDYIIEGTLYSKGIQLASSEVVMTFDKGEQSFDLSFYGKILHDQKIDGELELRNISISYVKPSLASKNLGLIRANYKTIPYSFDQFHNISFNNRLLLDKARIGLSN